MAQMEPGTLAALIGLLAGVILGFAARLGDFCTLYAIETAVYAGDQRRLRLWGIAAGSAILTAFLADAISGISLSAHPLLAQRWNPLASILGGLVFGYGMGLAGNCGFGALVRCGAGDLRALLVVTVIGITAMATGSGVLSTIRELFETRAAAIPQGFAHLIGNQTGFSPFAVALPIGVALYAWALSHPPLRRSYHQIGWATAAGIAAACCLIGTAVIGHSGGGAMEIEGPSFALPLGTTILWLMNAAVGGPSFGSGLCLGVLAGAMAGSAIRHTFGRRDLESAPRRLTHQLSGAVLMGIGGTVAGGDVVGQGLTGMALLSYSAPVSLMAIIIGALIGLRHLMGRVARD